MYWQEPEQTEGYAVPDDIVDVAFRITCRCLPVDHSYALSEALTGALPWFKGAQGVGLHPVHVADSGNGWMRPENADDLIYLSRRTRLVLRLPRELVAEAQVLTGQRLNVAGHPIDVLDAVVRPLSTITTVFSRYVVTDNSDEDRFLQAMLGQLQGMGVRPTKMLCGMQKAIITPDGPVRTRSLMLADLTVDESIRLQQRGLGPLRQLGCGLFIPHKDIKEVKQVLD